MLVSTATFRLKLLRLMTNNVAGAPLDLEGVVPPNNVLRRHGGQRSQAVWSVRGASARVRVRLVRRTGRYGWVLTRARVGDVVSVSSSRRRAQRAKSEKPL